KVVVTPGEHPLAKIGELEMQLEPLKDLESVGDPPLHTGTTEIGTLRRDPKRQELDIGGNLVHVHGVVAIPVVLEAPQHVDVLLRHRLLREAEIGERTLAVEVDDEPRHLAVADLKHGCCLRGHPRELQAACLAASAPAVKYEHALVVQLTVLLDFAAES